MTEFFSELAEEFTDFFEDLADHLSHRHPVRTPRVKTAVVGGVLTTVRPAYVFAERVDNTLKLISGISIAASAVTASFLGFPKLSDLLDVLIYTFPGRMVMVIIGLSYFTIALWKLVHLGDKK